MKGWDVSLVRESAAKQATTEIVGEVRSARKVAHAALEGLGMCASMGPRRLARDRRRAIAS